MFIEIIFILIFIFLMTIFGSMTYAQCWTKGYDGWNLIQVAPFKAVGTLDATRTAIQINALKQPTDEWAAVTAVYDGATATTNVIFSSLQETDGECFYRVLINGKLILAYQNPQIYKTLPVVANYAPYTVGVKDVVVPKDAKIQVEFMSNSNKLIPEGTAFGYARARWKSLSIGSCPTLTVNKWLPLTSINSTPENTVDVYPNPCTDLVTITNVSGNADVKLFNILGKELTITKDKAARGYTINTGPLTKGMYFVSVNGSLTKLMKR